MKLSKVSINPKEESVHSLISFPIKLIKSIKGNESEATDIPKNKYFDSIILASAVKKMKVDNRIREYGSSTCFQRERLI